MKELIDQPNKALCTSQLRPVRDTLELLSGKWKVLLLMVLAVRGKSRFMEMLREIDGITPKMLSKELRDLEQNQLVTRTVLPTTPVSVEYELTAYGDTLEPVIIAVRDWGMTHRARMTGRPVPLLKRKPSKAA